MPRSADVQWDAIWSKAVHTQRLDPSEDGKSVEEEEDIGFPVAKTPAPGGPVPIPYPNTGMGAGDLTKDTKLEAVDSVLDQNGPGDFGHFGDFGGFDLIG